MSEQPSAGKPWAPGPPLSQPDYWTDVPPLVAAPPLVEPLTGQPAARILVAALLAGLGAQLLFFSERAGLNVPLWVGLVLIAGWLLRRRGARLDSADRWLGPAALAFASFISLRDDAALLAFDLPVAGALTLAAVVAVGGSPVSRRAWTGLACLGAAALALVVSGATRLSSGRAPLASSLSRDVRLLRVVRGVLVALPLVIIFAAMFSAADAVFSAYVQATFGLELNLVEIFFRLLFAAMAAWLFAGTVVSSWLARPLEVAAQRDAEPIEQSEQLAEQSATGGVGSIEAVVVLLALDLVFGFFVVLQAAYLFGGADTLAISGMTYSEYARRGFFELILVAILAGTVILATDRLIRERDWAYRAAAIGLGSLTAAVLLSALVRVGLYQAAYGWTELRFYALAAIAWLALGITATMVAVALDRTPIVPRVLVGGGLLIALVANLVGPQAFVTGQNLERASDPVLVAPGGKSGLDLHYLSYLGDDSIPALVGALPRLPAAEREAADRLLRGRAVLVVEEAGALGWPSWNLARQRAIEALADGGYVVLVGR